MSSFEGLICEIPGISIDRFDGENLQSVIFLLSHCHTDHMQGLEQNFCLQLKKSDHYLYCSSVSKKILETAFKTKVDTSVIKVLELYSPFTLSYVFNGQKMSVTVRCYPSGHCPGSVMFTLEKDDLSILYTGDFRYNVDDMKKMKVFKSFDGFIKKKFSTIYLDTTFLSELYPKFPSRQDSVREIIRISKGWLDADIRNVIRIKSSANYGPEYIYKKLAVAFNTKIHVQEKLYESFVAIGISDYVTNNANDPNVRIHDCCYRNYSQNLYCNRSIDSKYILTITASALVWKNWRNSSVSRIKSKQQNEWNVCYSTHSSFEELKAFIEYAQCDKIVPFVVPFDSTKNETLKWINSWNSNSESEDLTFDLSHKQKKCRLETPFQSENISSEED